MVFEQLLLFKNNNCLEFVNKCAEFYHEENSYCTPGDINDNLCHLCQFMSFMSFMPGD